jgi:Uma2 family endonuclease
MRKEHADRRRAKFWNGADLVMEVVSGDDEDRHRDLVEKRQEYARAGIPEYWIIDPEQEKIIVLLLRNKQYVIHGEFSKGQVATSHSLPGFTVDVSASLTEDLPKASAKSTRKSKRPRRS